ncbi:MAG: hypothetical protein AAGE65_11850 [Planctomycetota bacterium]
MTRSRRKPRRRLAFAVGIAGAIVGSTFTPACDRLKEPEFDLENLYSYTPAPIAVMLTAAEVNGRINYPLIARDYADYIDRFVELCAEHGPRSEPTVYYESRHRAAYYVNVHNGLILQTWMRHGAGTGDVDLRFDPAWRDARIHRVDGQTVSINDVAELALRQGHRFVPLVLASGTVTGPPIPARPLPTETFERALDHHARVFLSDERAVQRVPTADGAGYVYYAPPVLREHAHQLGDLEELLDRFVPELYPHKLDLLQAAHLGTLRFREPSDRIHLPGTPLSSPSLP